MPQSRDFALPLFLIGILAASYFVLPRSGSGVGIQSAGAPVLLVQPEHGREPSQEVASPPSAPEVRAKEPAAGEGARQAQAVTTWMLTYRNSWGTTGQVLQSVDGLASRAACEAAWTDIKEVLSQSLPERLVMPYKCIRVEKLAR